MRSLCLGLLGLSLLAGCSPTTPLFIARIGTQEVVEYKTLKTNRMTAAIEEDGDLLTYSAQAIRGIAEFYQVAARRKGWQGVQTEPVARIARLLETDEEITQQDIDDVRAETKRLVLVATSGALDVHDGASPGEGCRRTCSVSPALQARRPQITCQ